MKSRGFTIVELVVVITIMGILMTLGTVQILGSQSKACDVERKSDIETIAMHLEIYYRAEGQYPTTDDIDDAASLNNILPDIDPKSTLAPGISGNSSLINAKDTNNPPTTTLTKNDYMYQPLTSDGELCTGATGATECRKFFIYAYLENATPWDGIVTPTNLYTIESKNQ